MDVNLVGADKGDVWTGFEWVKPERYEQLRAGPMPNLPPIQPLPGEDCMAAQMQCAHNYADEANFGRSPKAGGGGGYTFVSSNATPPPKVDPERIIAAMLTHVIGENPLRGGLLETPARVAKAWKHWTSGYGKDPAELLKVFEDGAEGVNEMVVVRDIPIYSHCEHHLAPIFGTATIGYLPDGKIVGLSKLNRLADMFARRLQVQERMTNQIADALMQHLAPHGCGVVVNARHMCMESRGVQQSSSTTTSALRGVFKDDPTVRAEFLSLARGGVA
jgi:GTP cyclohydrolase I